MQQICSKTNIMIGAGKKEYDKYENFDKENKLYINNINDAPKNISKNKRKNSFKTGKNGKIFGDSASFR